MPDSGDITTAGGRAGEPGGVTHSVSTAQTLLLFLMHHLKKPTTLVTAFLQLGLGLPRVGRSSGSKAFLCLVVSAHWSPPGPALAGENEHLPPALQPHLS